jgi:hypothetical protein
MKRKDNMNIIVNFLVSLSYILNFIFLLSGRKIKLYKVVIEVYTNYEPSLLSNPFDYPLDLAIVLIDLNYLNSNYILDSLILLNYIAG